MFKKKDDFIEFFLQHQPPHENLTFDSLLDEWHNSVDELKTLYEKRENDQAFELMSKGIQCYVYALYLANDENIHKLDIFNWKKKIEHFLVRPVNITERLEFIIEHPTKYDSFIQLKQLYKELIKKNAVHKRKK